MHFDAPVLFTGLFTGCLNVRCLFGYSVVLQVIVC